MLSSYLNTISVSNTNAKINYTHAFDNVWHKNLFELLGKLNLYEKDVRLIHNIYWEQITCMQLNKYTNLKHRDAFSTGFI